MSGVPLVLPRGGLPGYFGPLAATSVRPTCGLFAVPFTALLCGRNRRLSMFATAFLDGRGAKPWRRIAV